MTTTTKVPSSPRWRRVCSRPRPRLWCPPRTRPRFTARASTAASGQAGACKSADNACKGQNGCKGKGWVEMSEDKCTKKGGTAAPDADKK